MVAVAVFLLTLGTRVGAQEVQFVSLIQDETCPLALEFVRQEPRLRSPDLVITGTISNPTRRNAQGIVLTAALVDASGRVVNLQLDPVPGSVGPGVKQSFRATFEHFAPTRGERIFLGIQAIRWSRTDEWRGTIKVVTAPAVLASNAIVR
jgi:hypothetical protein